MSFTVLVSMPNPNTTRNTTIMATNEAGTTFVIFGKTITINTVNITRPSMVHKAGPLSQVVPALVVIVNCFICAMKMTTANPFTKPYITDWGTRRMNFASLNIPTVNCSIPASATAANTYSTPCDFINEINTITVAPAPPDTMAGLPP